jgi:hypothetical protein
VEFAEVVAEGYGFEVGIAGDEEEAAKMPALEAGHRFLTAPSMITLLY